MFEENDNPTRLTDDDQLNLGNLQHFDNHDFTQIKRQQDDASFVLFILGFLINLCWVVNWALHRSSPSMNARKWAKFSGIAYLVVVLLFILAWVAMFVLYGFTIFGVLSGMLAFGTK